MEVKEEITNEEKALLKRLLRDECDYVLPVDVMDEFLDLGEIVTVRKWENIISADTFDPNLYIAMEGVVRCWYWDGDGERTAYFSTIPTVFLNYHSYYGHKRSFYNFQACTAVKLLRVKSTDFNELLKKSHEFALWNLRLVQCQLFWFEIKHRSNTGSAMERYKKLIKELPDIMQEVPLQIVASYLGITPQYLSRLRKDLVNK